MGRRARWAAVLAAGAVMIGGGVTAHADVIGGIGGCAWTSGPNTADTGCSYTATLPLATAAWIGGGPASITGAGPQFCAAGVCAQVTACVSLQVGGGVCAYTQTPGTTINVSAPGSTAGLAGLPQPLDQITTSSAAACAWLPPAGGCSYTLVDNFPAPTLIEVAWLNSATPSVNGVTTPFFCNVPPTNGNGDCTFSVPTTAAGTQLITISADPTSTGVSAQTTL